MFPRKLFLAIIALALATLACSIRFNSPKDRVRVGAMQTKSLNVPVPAGEVANLTLSFGAGELRVRPGETELLVEGTATFNLDELAPKIDVDSNNVEIKSGNLEQPGIPAGIADLKNSWVLMLGNTPLNLKVNAGAYKGFFELGGLALRGLEFSDGASETRVNFGAPNLVDMDILRYSTGASSVKLEGLGNANFTSMIFRSGAGDHTLDFGGNLRKNASIVVESGISHVTIIVPEGVPAVLSFKGGLSNVTARGGWEKSGDLYIVHGSGPALTISVDMSAGSLELRTSP